MGGHGGLAGPRHARYQGAGATPDAALQHLVKSGDAAGDAFCRCFVCKIQRRHRQHRQTVLIDQKGIFVGAMVGAAIFDDAQAPRRHLLNHAVVQQDDAIGNIFLKPVPGQCAVASFGGDHGGDPLVLQPAEQAAQFRTQQAVVGQAGEQRLKGIQHHPSGAHLVDGVIEADEQTVEIIFAGLLDLAAFDADIIDDQFAGGRKGVEVIAQRGAVAGQFLLGFLETHEDAGFTHHRGLCQEGQGEQCFTAAGAATDKGWSAAGQSPASYRVKTRNTGTCLR